MSDQKDLYQALSAIQNKGLTAKESGNNPHFSSSYSTLEDVWEVLRPELKTNKLTVLQSVDVIDVAGQPKEVLTTTVRHDSGENTKSNLPLYLAKQDMQGIGSAITYARRYALTTMFNVITSDDDGNAASQTAEAQESDPDSTIKFGKHSGKKWRDIPVDYLNWLSENGRPEAKKQAEDEIDRRMLEAVGEPDADTDEEPFPESE